jgi:DsbC/DsbD-like thiol-disulfide interchange protein
MSSKKDGIGKQCPNRALGERLDSVTIASHGFFMSILRTLFVMGLLLGAAAAVKAEPSHAFLLQGGRQGGAYLLGLQVKLNPGWMTYWREPGEAGIAPKIGVAGSKNVRRVNMEFPVSKKFNERGLEVRGYENEVIFPLQVTPKNPRKPVHLRLNFTYGVCEKICLSEGIEFEQELSSKPVSAELLLIMQARARVPGSEKQVIIEGDLK